jgi:hypothetical protein
MKVSRQKPMKDKILSSHLLIVWEATNKPRPIIKAEPKKFGIEKGFMELLRYWQ